MKKYLILSSILFLCVLACSSDDEETPTDGNANTSANILLIIADDLGLDALNGYAEGAVKANTPKGIGPMRCENM